MSNLALASARDMTVYLFSGPMNACSNSSADKKGCRGAQVIKYKYHDVTTRNKAAQNAQIKLSWNPRIHVSY